MLFVGVRSRCNTTRPPHPRLACRDGRETPLFSRRDGVNNHRIPKKRKEKFSGEEERTTIRLRARAKLVFPRRCFQAARPDPRQLSRTTAPSDLPDGHRMSQYVARVERSAVARIDKNEGREKRQTIVNLGLHLCLSFQPQTLILQIGIQWYDPEPQWTIRA
jgi:hypothetical protein